MRTLTIADNTFRESVRQPFYTLVIVLVLVLLLTHYFLPFFTLSDDILMFKDVCLAYILMGLLVMALLLASKVVDEEIENKTMLTLMSKPVRRWELVLGKFLGVMAAVTLALVILAAVLSLATWMRVPDELRISTQTFDEGQIEKLAAARHMHAMSLLPAYVLIWLQVAVMASIAVALSTRIGMVPNVVVGAGLFVAGHLTRYIEAAGNARPPWQHGLASTVVTVLPFLEDFNLNDYLIYKDIVFSGPAGKNEVSWQWVWSMVGQSGIYAMAYIAAVLLIAMALFRTRELS